LGPRVDRPLDEHRDLVPLRERTIGDEELCGRVPVAGRRERHMPARARRQVLVERLREVADARVGAAVRTELYYRRPRVDLEEGPEMRAVRALEAEDRLLLVPHDEEVRVVVEGESVEERMLERIRILMLVREDVLVALLERRLELVVRAQH